MVFEDNLASVIESIYIGDKLTFNSHEADTYINPTSDSYVGKKLIFNMLPVKNLDIKKLSELNTVISRIPLNLDESEYTLEPYNMEFTTKKIRFTAKNYKILSPYHFNTDNFEFNRNNGTVFIPRYQMVTGDYNDGYPNIAALIAKLSRVTNCWRSLNAFMRRCIERFSHTTRIYEDPESIYRTMLNMETNSIDVCGSDNYFRGPTIRKRRPDKRMNVKNGYFYGKFKTYRVTDKYRSFDLNYNMRDGFHLFYINKAYIDTSDFSDFAINGGLDLCYYFFFYFCKKNHFARITGDILFEPLQNLIDPEGSMGLHISIFPEGLVDDDETFHISVVGMSKWI